MDRVLAIDTSGSACSIALLDQGRTMAERHEEIGRGHAEILIPWIADLPDGGRADAILVGCGPGSFTGVRVGIAAARALGLAWGVQVHGFSSLALIALNADVRGAMLVAIEGGHGELFVQLFNFGPVLAATGPLASLLPADAVVRFQPDFVAGNGASRFLEAGGCGQSIPAAVRAALAWNLPEALRSLPPTPTYGRSADAKPMAR